MANESKYLSGVAYSNLYTKAVAAKKDPRQAVPSKYEMPDEKTRLFLAQLILEEAKETIHALGFYLTGVDDEGVVVSSRGFKPQADLINAIDGCCDTIYVCTGAMIAMGAPDLPHLNAVCRANDAKFPGGVAIVDANGKYQKPEGWRPPHHELIMDLVSRDLVNLQETGRKLAP